MSFLGKKYRRVKSELHKLFEKAEIPPEDSALLKQDAAFKITKEDETTYRFTLYFDNTSKSHTFKLDKPTEVTKKDGKKTIVTYHLENDAVLTQEVEWAPSVKTHFRSVFEGNRCVLTITTPDAVVDPVKVYYEVEENKIPFLGKKYLRVAHKNLDEALVQALEPQAKSLVKQDAAFKITKEDETTYRFTLYFDKTAKSHTFKLGEPTEVTKRDGGKTIVTYHLESDAVLTQEVEWAPSVKAHFRSVFDGNHCVLTITTPDKAVSPVKIYYEVMDHEISFLGKKYTRVGNVNLLDKVFKDARLSDTDVDIMKKNTAFKVSRVDDTTFLFTLYAGVYTKSHQFKLDEETEVVRRNGAKSKVVYHMESDNVLDVIVEYAPSLKTRFRRVFKVNSCDLTIIAPEEHGNPVTVHYEVKEYKMSFLGKKYTRISHENLDKVIELAKLSQSDADIIMRDTAFEVSRVDDTTFLFTLYAGAHKKSHQFKLDEETEVVRRNGAKSKVVYQMESNNVLDVIVEYVPSVKTRFRRVFNETSCDLTIIAPEEHGNPVTVHYEVKEYKMSFLGKKFTRISHENLDKVIELAKLSQSDADIIMRDTAFKVSRVDDATFLFTLYAGVHTKNHQFKLDEEIEVQRRNGAKSKVVYHMESDNVLDVIVEYAPSLKTRFRRVFNENSCDLTIIAPEGHGAPVTVHYEIKEYNMSFLGKKYTRTSHENLDKVIELAKLSQTDADIIMRDTAFKVSRVDDTTFLFTLYAGVYTKSHPFKLDEETEVVRRNGSKSKVVYQMESDNVLDVTVEYAASLKTRFRRVFNENSCDLTIIAPEEHGTPVTVHYEVKEYKMSFLGKKYTRISHENLDKVIELAKLSQTDADIMMRDTAFQVSRVDDTTFLFTLYAGVYTKSHQFKMDEEIEVQRRNGAKSKVVYHMESDNVLDVIVEYAPSLKTRFRRVFNENSCDLTIIAPEGHGTPVTVHYKIKEYNMSFLGKKYTRTSHENLDKVIELAKLSQADADIIKRDTAFKVSRVDDTTFLFTLYAGVYTKSHQFKLDEETEVVRRNGAKSKVVYQMESDNVLDMIVEYAPSLKTRFRRVFNENSCDLTIIAPEGHGAPVTVHYEVKEYKMSFLGKKYTRNSHEHIDKLIESAQLSEADVDMIKQETAFVVSRVDDTTFLFTLYAGEYTKSHQFKLDEETEVLRPDGAKSKVVYQLIGDDVLDVIEERSPSSKTHLRREFDESSCVLRVLEPKGHGTPVVVHYQLQEFKMSFLGKKYTRVASENLDELFEFVHIPKSDIFIMKKDSSFVFSRVDDTTFLFTLYAGVYTKSHQFKLDEEIEVVRRNGAKSKLVYHMENDDVLDTMVEWSPSYKTRFRRVFDANGCVLNIQPPEGFNVPVRVFYQLEDYKMTFIGKKYKRVACENYDKLLELARVSEQDLKVIKNNSAFKFSRVNDTTFQYTLYTDEYTKSHPFKLDEETEVLRQNGETIKILFRMHDDNVLDAIVEWSPAVKTHLRRLFDGNSCVLTIITPELKGNDVPAKVFYEAEEYKMSFLGKKYMRTASENLEKIISHIHLPRASAAILLKKDTGLTILRLDEETFLFTLHAGPKSRNHTFRLDEETEVTRRDGVKAKVIYRMEGDDVLTQYMEFPNQKTQFRRVFKDNRCILTITAEGSADQAKIYYEVQKRKRSNLVRFLQSVVKQKAAKKSEADPNRTNK